MITLTKKTNFLLKSCGIFNRVRNVLMTGADVTEGCKDIMLTKHFVKRSHLQEKLVLDKIYFHPIKNILTSYLN